MALYYTSPTATTNRGTANAELTQQIRSLEETLAQKRTKIQELQAQSDRETPANALEQELRAHIAGMDTNSRKLILPTDRRATGPRSCNSSTNGEQIQSKSREQIDAWKVMFEKALDASASNEQVLLRGRRNCCWWPFTKMK